MSDKRRNIAAEHIESPVFSRLAKREGGNISGKLTGNFYLFFPFFTIDTVLLWFTPEFANCVLNCLFCHAIRCVSGIPSNTSPFFSCREMFNNWASFFIHDIFSSAVKKLDPPGLSSFIQVSRNHWVNSRSFCFISAFYPRHPSSQFLIPALHGRQTPH